LGKSKKRFGNNPYREEPCSKKADERRALNRANRRTFKKILNNKDVDFEVLPKAEKFYEDDINWA
jgi:hypothetical protein